MTKRITSLDCSNGTDYGCRTQWRVNKKGYAHLEKVEKLPISDTADYSGISVHHDNIFSRIRAWWRRRKEQRKGRVER